MASLNRSNRPAETAARASLDWWSAFSRTCEIGLTRGAGRGAIAAIAARRAADLIRFARAHSPFYRDAWSGQPDVALDKLPVVHKRDLMARFDDWVTDRSVDRRGVEVLSGAVEQEHAGSRCRSEAVGNQADQLRLRQIRRVG